MSADKIIGIPGPLYEKLEDYQKKSIFSSLDDLIIYILQEYLDKQSTSSAGEKKYEDEVVQKRLKNLGYL